MGQAFHRKSSVPLGRGTKTHGISYSNPNPVPRPRVLSAEEIAERNRLKEAAQSTRGIREWNIYCLMTVAALTLDAWEDSILAQKSLSEDPATERVVDKAYRVVESALNKYCDKTGIEVDHLIQSLQGPRDKPKIEPALDFVRNKFVSVFASVLPDGEVVKAPIQ